MAEEMLPRAASGCDLDSSCLFINFFWLDRDFQRRGRYVAATSL